MIDFGNIQKFGWTFVFKGLWGARIVHNASAIRTMVQCQMMKGTQIGHREVE